MSEDNRAFVERMILGDEGAFDWLYHTYSPKLYRMAYFITGDRFESEDILQETFVSCFLHRSSLKKPESFESWICQILVRTARRTAKRRKNKAEVSFEGILEQEDRPGQGEKLCENTEAASLLEMVIEQERNQELQKAVLSLGERHRTVVVLYYYNGFSVKEIAKITQTLEGTVKSRLFQSRMLLKSCLEQGQDSFDQERGLCHES